VKRGGVAGTDNLERRNKSVEAWWARNHCAGVIQRKEVGILTVSPRGRTKFNPKKKERPSCWLSKRNATVVKKRVYRNECYSK